MITETATIYALSALFFTMVSVTLAFSLVAMVFYIVAWGIIQVLKPIFNIIDYGN